MSETPRYRDAVAGREAPGALEGKLMSAFREHRAWRRARQRRMWSGLAAALAIAAALAVIAFPRLRPTDVRVPPPAPLVAKGAAPGMEPPVQPPAPPPRKPRPRRKSPKPAHEPSLRQPQQEFATGFLPLDASGTLPASGEVIRMQIPRSTLTMFGLPVNEQRLSVPVRADVLFGEDGRAHAVRFVTTTSFETPSER
ncbi:MAG TPA: hypothetical protein VMJ34_21555 [Bryobacteraceae bacterium]|nr:hypothetical protein [Bryobacteraceae bacterium]